MKNITNYFSKHLLAIPPSFYTREGVKDEVKGKINFLKMFTLFLLLMLAGSSYSNAQCVAGFTSNVNMVNGQYGTGLVQFTDTSHASAGDTLISWAWNFGDGVTATIKNPIHYYPTPGNYTVTLFVHDNTSNNGTQQQYLINTAYPVGCQAYINYAYPQPYPTVPGPPVPISFDGNANIFPTNDGIASVLWNFGDGTTSTLLNPVHTYPQDTAYNATYTITTVNGCTSIHSVVVHAAPCTIYATNVVSPTDSTIFNLQITGGVPPITVNWQQATSPWNWAAVPASQLSNNNLTLQALDSTIYSYGQIYGANGCQLGGHSPFALNGFNFNYNYNQGINVNFVFLQQGGNSLTVDFADNSVYNYNMPLGNNVTQFWNFGDGITSTLASPTHVYANYGSYAIIHSVTDANALTGIDTTNINIALCNYSFISSIAPPTNNNNVLIASAVGGFPPLAYTWNDTLNSANPTTINTIAANQPGYYSVHITDANGCIASQYSFNQQDPQIQYNPHFQDTCTANFAYSIGTTSVLPGANNVVSFFAEENNWGFLSSAHTYTWTYSDGYIDTTNLNSYGFYNMRPYVAGQVYDATLTVTGGGCNASSTQTVDFSIGACNLSPLWPWNTNYFLFQNQYPLKINANAANGAGNAASRTYLWNNGSTAPYVYAYSSGEYCVTITDSLGCSKTLCYTYYAPHNSLITLCGNVYNDANNNGVYDGGETPAGSSTAVQITGGGNTYNASVDGTGHYSANVPAGNYMITYASTAGHNFITPTSPDTIAHYANVTATYGNNLCGYNFGISNNTSFIGGKLFYDDDSDGVLDSTEIGIAYQPIGAGAYTVFTDSLGFFKFNVVANNYSLIYTPQNAFAGYSLTTPNSITINANIVGGNFSNNNFGIHTTNSGADLGVSLWPTSVVNNGFPAHYTIKYFNNGITSVNNTITLTYDSTRTYQSSSIAPTSVNTATHTITWNVPFINAYTNNYIYIHFTALVALSINTPITTTAHISNASGTETLLANNTSLLNQLSVGSFDPNDKLVIATNTDDVTEQNISSITANQEIDYVIHFQNVGNYQAINVRVEDEMSTMLDADSYVLLGGSHNCQVTRQNNKVTYKFDNINLPPESENEEGSNGFVSFKINANSSLVEGDIITDMAKIYFDYNQPILTNYANILMVNPSVISDSQSIIITNNNLGVFPNPLSGRGFVKFTLDDDMPVKLAIAGMNGKDIMEQNINGKKGMNYYNLDVSTQNTGLYILKVASEKSTLFHKISIVNK